MRKLTIAVMLFISSCEIPTDREIVLKEAGWGHKCPYDLCPMKNELQFNGCGSCNPGMDCWTLDSIHWRYPKETYDQNEMHLITHNK